MSSPQVQPHNVYRVQTTMLGTLSYHTDYPMGPQPFDWITPGLISQQIGMPMDHVSTRSLEWNTFRPNQSSDWKANVSWVHSAIGLEYTW